MAVAATKVLIEISNLEHLIDLNSLWARNLFLRIDFVKRAAAKGRPDIPQDAKNAAKILLLHQMVDEKIFHPL